MLLLQFPSEAVDKMLRSSVNLVRNRYIYYHSQHRSVNICEYTVTTYDW